MSNQQRNEAQDVQANQAVFAALFATVAMTGYLWNQIVSGLVPPVI